MTRARWLKSLKSNVFFFGNQLRSHVFIIFTLGNKTWPMKSQEICFFACKFSFTYFMGNWLFWQVHENVNVKIRDHVVIRSNQLQRPSAWCPSDPWPLRSDYNIVASVLSTNGSDHTHFPTWALFWSQLHICNCHVSIHVFITTCLLVIQQRHIWFFHTWIRIFKISHGDNSVYMLKLVYRFQIML